MSGRDGWCCVAYYTKDANGVHVFKNRVSYEFTTDTHVVSIHVPVGAVGMRVSFRSYGLSNVCKLEAGGFSTAIEKATTPNNILEEYPLIFGGFITEEGVMGDPTLDGYVTNLPALGEKYTAVLPISNGRYTLYYEASTAPWAAIGLYGASGSFKRLTMTTEGKLTFDVGATDSVVICARTTFMTHLALFREGDVQTPEQVAHETRRELARVEDKVNSIEVTTLEALDDNVKGIAHRGYNVSAPENTLAAFRAAADLGFKYVECDVQFTSDGVPVILHDTTVDRTSNGSGAIASMTFAAARALDFGGGERIPSFMEFVALCKSLAVHPYIELKGSLSTEQAHLLVGIVRMYGMRDKVTFIGQSWHLAAIAAADARVRLGLLCDTITADVIQSAVALKNDHNEVFVDSNFGTVTDDAVLMCVAAELPLEVWTVDNAASVVSMNPYISGVTSNTLRAGAVLYHSKSVGSMTSVPSTLPTGESGGGGAKLYKHTIVGYGAGEYEYYLTAVVYSSSANSMRGQNLPKDIVYQARGVREDILPDGTPEVSYRIDGVAVWDEWRNSFVFHVLEAGNNTPQFIDLSASTITSDTVTEV